MLKKQYTLPVLAVIVFSFFVVSRLQAASDDFDLSKAIIGGNSPSDVASWPATATITDLTLTPSITVSFDKSDGPNMWPDQRNLGVSDISPNDPIQYTIWMFRKVNGQWAGAGFIRLWHNAPQTGLKLENTPCDWFYYVPEMQPDKPLATGEQIAFMVTAGVERRGTFTNVRERSNVKVATVPANLPSSSCEGGGTTGPPPDNSPPGGSDPGPGIIPDGGTSPDSTPATSGWAGSLAFNSTDNTWLVVSNAKDDKGGTSKAEYGRILDNTGKPLGEQFRIAANQFEPLAPRAAYSKDLNEYLVVWINAGSDNGWWGQYVKSDGKLDGSEFRVSHYGQYPSNAHSLQYDGKNKVFVLVWENRNPGINAFLITIKLDKTPGPLIKVAATGENRGPVLAVNETKGEYCVGYTITDNPKYPNNTVAVRAVNAATGAIGPESAVVNSANIIDMAYNSVDDAYFIGYVKDNTSGSYGMSLPTCSGQNADSEIQIQENGISTLTYNPTSNTFAVIGQDQTDYGNELTIFDSDGNSLYSSQFFPDAKIGNFAPVVAANLTTGTYTITSAQNYTMTRFQTNIGQGQIPTTKRDTGPIPPPAKIPPQNEGLPTDIGKLIQAIFNWSFTIIGLVIFLRFFYAGFLWFTAAGSSQQISKAQTIMKNALYGTALLFSSYLILNTINPDFVKSTVTLPGLPGIDSQSSNNGSTP